MLVPSASLSSRPIPPSSNVSAALMWKIGWLEHISGADQAWPRPSTLEIPNENWIYRRRGLRPLDDATGTGCRNQTACRGRDQGDCSRTRPAVRKQLRQQGDGDVDRFGRH